MRKKEIFLLAMRFTLLVDRKLSAAIVSRCSLFHPPVRSLRPPFFQRNEISSWMNLTTFFIRSLSMREELPICVNIFCNYAFSGFLSSVAAFCLSRGFCIYFSFHLFFYIFVCSLYSYSLGFLRTLTVIWGIFLQRRVSIIRFKFRRYVELFRM